MVPGVPCVDRGNWGRERDLAARSWHTKVPIFYRKGRSSSDIHESQPGKLMLETFSWDNNVNWVDRGTDKNRQSMTSCGFCCYYLEHCSKTNHIAIKWTKYENVYELVASQKICWPPIFLRLSVTRVMRTRRVEHDTKGAAYLINETILLPWFNKNM